MATETLKERAGKWSSKYPIDSNKEVEAWLAGYKTGKKDAYDEIGELYVKTVSKAFKKSRGYANASPPPAHSDSNLKPKVLNFGSKAFKRQEKRLARSFRPKPVQQVEAPAFRREASKFESATTLSNCPKNKVTK